MVSLNITSFYYEITLKDIIMRLNLKYMFIFINITIILLFLFIYCSKDSETSATTTTPETTTTTIKTYNTTFSTGSLVTYLELNETANGYNGIPLSSSTNGTIPENAGIIPDGVDGVLQITGTIEKCSYSTSGDFWTGDVDTYQFNVGDHNNVLLYLDWSDSSTNIDLDLRIYKYSTPFAWKVAAYNLGEHRNFETPEFILSPDQRDAVFFPSTLTPSTDYVAVVLGWSCGTTSAPYVLSIVGK